MFLSAPRSEENDPKATLESEAITIFLPFPAIAAIQTVTLPTFKSAVLNFWKLIRSGLGIIGHHYRNFVTAGIIITEDYHLAARYAPVGGLGACIVPLQTTCECLA